MKYPRLLEELDRRRRMFAKDIKQARILKAKGISYAAIARMLNISETSVKYWTDENYRLRARESARQRSRKRFAVLSEEEKKAENKRTMAILMRKKDIQIEYRKYAAETSKKYSRSKRGKETRKRRRKENLLADKAYQRTQYQKHRIARLEARKKYVKENYQKILADAKAYYQANKEKVLARQKSKRKSY